MLNLNLRRESQNADGGMIRRSAGWMILNGIYNRLNQSNLSKQTII